MSEEERAALDAARAALAILRMFVIADATERWPVERVEKWHAIMTRRLDDDPGPSELGRAQLLHAIDDLAEVLRTQARRTLDRSA